MGATASLPKDPVAAALAPYGVGLALLTDFYQVSMAYGYWKQGMAEQQACFHLYFRKHPFKGGFTLAAGLASVVAYLEAFRFDASDLAYLAEMKDPEGGQAFEPAFLDYLRELKFACDVDAMPEGTVAFPNEPLVRVVGPLLQAQLIETALLNLVNFQSLIATKAARVCLAAQGDAVLEFGLRRAQGIDGGLAASRSAYLGGASATSNVLAGKLYGIPVKGTHAHSWVMSFPSEMAAFQAYAEAMPGNGTFLVDTFDTLKGVEHAMEVGRALRARGHDLQGIRLDSGDLAYLSQEARKKLDAGGFTKTKIVASNDLNEQLITSLKAQGARIDVWGVGTQLATAYDQPALGGVYKLAALKDAQGNWVPKVKLSENAIKISTPGILQVRRFDDGQEAIADAIYDSEGGIPAGEMVVVDPHEMTHRKKVPAGTAFEDLLVPVFRGGQRVGPLATLEEARERAQKGLARFHPGVKRFEHPHAYPAGLELGLFEKKLALVLKAKGL